MVDEVCKKVETRCFPLGAKREQEENIKHKYDKSYYFYRSHVYLQPHYPLEYENIPLAYEGYKIKDNYGERKSLQSDCSGEENIHEKECELEQNKETILTNGGCTSHEHDEVTTCVVDDHTEIGDILDMDNGVTTDG